MDGDKDIEIQIDETEWSQLPSEWRGRIIESLQQAETGKLTLSEDAVIYIRKKYGLNRYTAEAFKC